MTPEQFTYWLQGFVEIREKESVVLTEREWGIIKDQLKTVFQKVTPVYIPPVYERNKDTAPYRPETDPFYEYKITC